MKKALLFAMGALMGTSSFGQQLAPAPSRGVYGQPTINVDYPNARTTSTTTHDSLVMLDVTSSDTSSNYYLSRTGTATDSGYLAGVNFAGYSGFAQRYDFNSTDSTISVLGAITLFTGNLHTSSTTTQTVVIKAWSPAAAITVRPTLIFSGFPGTIIDSTLPISITKLGIGINDTAPDSFSTHWFPTATSYLATSFFIGYTTSYNFHSLGGDTIALRTTRLGERTTPEYTVSGGDTTVNTQVAIVDTSGGSSYWYDAWATLGFNLNLIIYPIIDSKVITTGVGITNKGLTFLGNYPNPATDYTNISFDLANNTEVQIVITDIAGHTVKTIEEGSMSAGQHTINMSTADLSAGTYVYVLKTTNGGGVASKLTVIK